MSSLHYFANRYRNRVSRKREFFNLYKTVFVILNMQKSHKISLFKILQLFYHVASQTSSIFTCNCCTKYRGLFSNRLCPSDCDFTGFWAKLSKSAVANKENFYHCCITSHFLVFLGFSGFVSLCKFLLSGITWFIFA